MNKLAKIIAVGLLAPSLAALAATDTAGTSAVTTMKFLSIPIQEKLPATVHKIFPYRSEDRVIVVVVDPIVCGQKPTNARFEISRGKISLHYDLASVAAGAVQGCTAHSTFDLANVPHGDFQVDFTSGTDTVRTAQMSRCPNVAPSVDIWDCMLPSL
jgi:hypothetical protein